MLGRLHLRVLSVRGFPTSTWPGLLDDLNRLGFAYRWSTRFLCLDKAEAEKELVRLRRQWFAKRKNIVALLRETIFQQESPLVDSDASNKAADADAALQELGSDQVAFGYVTATVTVLDADAAAADEKLRAVERTMQGRGFVTIPETLNAVEAWLSSIPGHAYANVRQPIVSTLNLAHMMPVSAVWAGPERNVHLDGPPLIVTRTDGATPFRLVTHIGDVGHTLVVGPTGMGKSVLLATLALQFRRYVGSRILAFDMGRSMRATILGLGGEHYDLGTDGAIAFQPLARIDQEGYRAWAAEWVEGRLIREGVAVGPPEKAAVWSALNSLASAPVEQRTLTGLSVLLQSNALRQALQPYVLGGAHGRLLDADTDRLGSASVQGFEMEELMHSKAAVLAVLGYLFARFDERFDGAPTLLILDEAWLFLDDPVFAARIRQWLKTLRKKNVSVIFATQSLADIQNSSIAPAIVESCASRPCAFSPSSIPIEASMGMDSERESYISTVLGLGLTASGSGMSQAQLLQPGQLAKVGIDAGRPIMEQISEMTGFPETFAHLDTIAVLFLAWLVLIVSFFVLAVQLFVTLIEFKLTTLAGFVLVPFALWNKTAFLAEKVLGNVVSSGIKVLVLAVIVGIGTGLFAEFRTPPGADPSIDHALTIMLAALAMLGLGIFGPGIATGLVSGAPQLGAGAAAGTALGAAGLAVAGGAAVAGAGSAVAAGARMAPGAARAAIGGGAAAARSASGLASGAQSAYQAGAAASGANGMRAAGAGLANVAKSGAGGVSQRIASGAKAVKERVAAFVADAAAPAAAAKAAAAEGGDAGEAGPPSPEPAWARQMRRKQQLSHAASTAAHVLRSGDHGGSGTGPSLRDGSNP